MVTHHIGGQVLPSTHADVGAWTWKSHGREHGKAMDVNIWKNHGREHGKAMDVNIWKNHGREHGKTMDVNMEKPDWEQ